MRAIFRIRFNSTGEYVKKMNRGGGYKFVVSAERASSWNTIGQVKNCFLQGVLQGESPIMFTVDKFVVSERFYESLRISLR
jgi:hypothetical protein